MADADSPTCAFAEFSSKWRRHVLILLADPRTVRLCTIRRLERLTSRRLTSVEDREFVRRGDELAIDVNRAGETVHHGRITKPWVLTARVRAGVPLYCNVFDSPKAPDRTRQIPSNPDHYRGIYDDHHGTPIVAGMGGGLAMNLNMPVRARPSRARWRCGLCCIVIVNFPVGQSREDLLETNHAQLDAVRVACR